MAQEHLFGSMITTALVLHLHNIYMAHLAKTKTVKMIGSDFAGRACAKPH